MLIIESMDVMTDASLNREQFDLLMDCSEKHDLTKWNEWRRRNPDRPVLLQNANLAKAWLRGADLRQADLRGANLRSVDLSGARRPDYSWRWANLSGADFRKADLCGTDFRGADLNGADFSQSYLYYTNFSWTNLSGANFNNADLWAFLFRANVNAADLRLANRRLAEFSMIGCAHAKKPPLSAGCVLALSHDAARRPAISDTGSYTDLQLAAG